MISDPLSILTAIFEIRLKNVHFEIQELGRPARACARTNAGVQEAQRMNRQFTGLSPLIKNDNLYLFCVKFENLDRETAVRFCRYGHEAPEPCWIALQLKNQ